MKKILITIAIIAFFATSCNQVKQQESKPVDTANEFEFIGGYPTNKDDVQKLYDEMDLQRATHAVQYYPVIRKYHNSLLRKKNKQIAKTIIAKEIAEIVFYILKNKTNFNNKFKGVELQHKKSLQWPRVVSPDV